MNLRVPIFHKKATRPSTIARSVAHSLRRRWDSRQCVSSISNPPVVRAHQDTHGRVPDSWPYIHFACILPVSRSSCSIELDFKHCHDRCVECQHSISLFDHPRRMDFPQGMKVYVLIKLFSRLVNKRRRCLFSSFASCVLSHTISRHNIKRPPSNMIGTAMNGSSNNASLLFLWCYVVVSCL